VLVLSKEALMLIGSYIMLKFHIVVYSKWYGKAAVFVMSLGIALTFWDKTYPWNLYLLYFSLVLTLYAFFHYFRLAARQLKEIKEHPDNPRDIYAEED
jgi:phosphatidylglycerophosphate synthase